MHPDKINPRGNGACPICMRTDDCRIKKAIAASISDFTEDEAMEMEIVIYSCPQFREKD